MNEQLKKELVDEVIRNARKDRLRLESVADGLQNGFGQLGDNSQEDGGALDPEVSAAFAEEIAKVAAELTNVNKQLIELLKIEAKKEEVKPRDPARGFSKDEREQIYEELQAEVN